MSVKKDNKKRVSLRLDRDIYDKVDSLRSYGESFTASLERILRLNLSYIDILDAIKVSSDNLEEAINVSADDPGLTIYWKNKYTNLKKEIIDTQTSEGWIEISDVKRIISKLLETE